jgi:hypothetical protein
MLIRLALVCADTIQVHVRSLCLCGICSVQGLVRMTRPEPDVNIFSVALISFGLPLIWASVRYQLVSISEDLLYTKSSESNCLPFV